MHAGCDGNFNELYCKDNAKSLPQCWWSTCACLFHRNLKDYWQQPGEMKTEKDISRSTRIEEIELDGDDQERNPDTSSLKE